MIERTALMAFGFSLALSAQQPSNQRAVVKVSGDTTGAACSAGAAVIVIQRWFSAMDAGDTVELRRLAAPAFEVFSAGVNGSHEPTFHADSVPDLLAYIARRHLG